MTGGRRSIALAWVACGVTSSPGLAVQAVSFGRDVQPLLADQPLAISFEMRELDEQVKFNHKNI